MQVVSPTPPDDAAETGQSTYQLSVTSVLKWITLPAIAHVTKAAKDIEKVPRQCFAATADTGPSCRRIFQIKQRKSCMLLQLHAMQQSPIIRYIKTNNPLSWPSWSTRKPRSTSTSRRSAGQSLAPCISRCRIISPSIIASSFITPAATS